MCDSNSTCAGHSPDSDLIYQEGWFSPFNARLGPRLAFKAPPEASPPAGRAGGAAAVGEREFNEAGVTKLVERAADAAGEERGGGRCGGHHVAGHARLARGRNGVA